MPIFFTTRRTAISAIPLCAIKLNICV
uniref:Uncharacterized protein n=1 Tax=Arundo donax TaxID=35708 RepID=A0A0A9BG29_ARUDO